VGWNLQIKSRSLQKKGTKREPLDFTALSCLKEVAPATFELAKCAKSSASRPRKIGTEKKTGLVWVQRPNSHQAKSVSIHSQPTMTGARVQM
jgi:hypothetical protein